MDLGHLQRALIGHGLKQPDQFGVLAAAVREEDFPDGLCRAMFAAMLRLHLAGTRIDQITLKHELGGDDAWDAPIVDVLGTYCGDLDAYCDILRREAQLARYKSAAVPIVHAETLEAAETAAEKLGRIGAGHHVNRITDAAAAANEFLDRMESQTRPEYVTTGFPQIDSVLFLELGDMAVIGGYPKAGKSLVAAQIAARLAETYRVGYFFLESSRAKLTDRLISHLSRVELRRIKTRDFRAGELQSINRACDKLSKLNLDIIDAAGMSVNDIQAISLNRRYQVIFVDYLQLVEAPGTKGGYEAVTSVSRALHTMGRKHGILVYATSQLRRPERQGKSFLPPNLSDLRESGQIEQDADIIWLLYPADPKDNSSNRVFNLAKNKEGESRRVYLRFDGAIQTMTEIPESAVARMERELAKVKQEQKAERRQEDSGRQATFFDLAEEDKTPWEETEDD